MTCDACTEAESNPLTGLYRDGCTECSARELAQSLEHAQARAAGKMLPAYLARLRAVWGDGWEAGHQHVKAWAKRT